jgi:hypothetical protein
LSRCEGRSLRDQPRHIVIFTGRVVGHRNIQSTVNGLDIPATCLLWVKALPLMSALLMRVSSPREGGNARSRPESGALVVRIPPDWLPCLLRHCSQYITRSDIIEYTDSRRPIPNHRPGLADWCGLNVVSHSGVGVSKGIPRDGSALRVPNPPSSHCRYRTVRHQ